MTRSSNIQHKAAHRATVHVGLRGFSFPPFPFFHSSILSNSLDYFLEVFSQLYNFCNSFCHFLCYIFRVDIIHITANLKFLPDGWTGKAQILAVKMAGTEWTFTYFIGATKILSKGGHSRPELKNVPDLFNYYSIQA